MGFIPKSAGFQAFGIFLATAFIVTMISVFNLAAISLAARKLGRRLRDFAEKTYCSFHDSDYSSFTSAAEENAPLREQGSQISKIASMNPQMPSKPSASLPPTKRNNRLYLFFLRYLLTTFPASEVITALDLLLYPSHRSQSPTAIATTISQITAIALTSGVALTLGVTDPPPVVTDATTRWNDLYNKHLRMCLTCSPTAIAGAHKQSISHCGVGTNLFKAFLAAREGLHDYDSFSIPSDPPNTTSLHPCGILPTGGVARDLAHRFRPSRSRSPDQVPQFAFTATNITDTANGKWSYSQPQHTQHLHPRISTQITMRKWIPAVASAFLVGFRVVLLPLWIGLLAIDYIAILAGLAALSIFANLRFEGEEYEEKKSSWSKRLIRLLMRPVWIIGREVKRG